MYWWWSVIVVIVLNFTVVPQDVTSYVHKIKCAVGVTGICRWHWAESLFRRIIVTQLVQNSILWNPNTHFHFHNGCYPEPTESCLHSHISYFCIFDLILSSNLQSVSARTVHLEAAVFIDGLDTLFYHITMCQDYSLLRYNTTWCGMLILMFQGTCCFRYQVGRWRQQVPAKHWWPSTKLCDITSQKTVLWSLLSAPFSVFMIIVLSSTSLTSLFSWHDVQRVTVYQKLSFLLYLKIDSLNSLNCVCVCVHACMNVHNRWASK